MELPIHGQNLWSDMDMCRSLMSIGVVLARLALNMEGSLSALSMGDIDAECEDGVDTATGHKS